MNLYRYLKRKYSNLNCLYKREEFKSRDLAIEGMSGDTLHSTMSFTLLLCLFLTLALSGIAEARRHRAKDKLDSGVCPGIRKNTPDFLHFMTSSSSDLELAAMYVKSGESSNTSNQQSGRQNKHTNQSGNTDTNAIGLSDEVTGFQAVQEQDVADKCINVDPCDHNAKFRTINGTCNNFKFPMWGVMGSALVRLIPAKYQDGEHKVRKSRSGKELPNVRQLSTVFFPDRNVPDKLNMLNVMQWGQLVAHDTTHIVQQDSGNQGLDCCATPCAAHQDICLSIQIPSKDPFYSKHHQTCMNMVRSATTNNLKCPLSPQQQVIAVTHFVDASLVYGSNDKVANSLRSHKNGLLEVQLKNKREFPPHSDNPKQNCDIVGNENVCYAAGDDRVNQNLGITVLQIILLREHNRLARALKKLNPKWDDERLYQEARRIVIAEVQRITYDAYLPIILGRKFVKAHGLVDGDGDDDFSKNYDEFKNPSTLNEFATAAYRAFHSMIPREVILYDEKFNPIKKLNIDDFFFRPFITQKPEVLDQMLRGLAAQPSQAQDNFFSVGITEFLFKSNKSFGKDLESIDMQRGRDHGLATYNDYRRACNLPPFAHFDELNNVMPKEAVQNLQAMYEHVGDVDLFLGGVLETRATGSLVGPTFQCIIGEQFKRWRDGDRFYYDFGDQIGSFTHEQLKEIRKITLAEIFCQNGDEIDEITLDVFHAPGSLNPITPCEKIIKMDLTPWKEK